MYVASHTCLQEDVLLLERVLRNGSSRLSNLRSSRMAAYTVQLPDKPSYVR